MGLFCNERDLLVLENVFFCVEIMKVEVNEMYMCMHTDFGGRGLSGFRDKISLWSIVVENFNRLELTQKIHANRDWCQVHAH